MDGHCGSTLKLTKEILIKMNCMIDLNKFINDPDGTVVSFNGIQYKFRSDIVSKFLVGSAEFSDGYSYEIPEEIVKDRNNMISIKEFVSKFAVFLMLSVANVRRYRVTHFMPCDFQAPLLAFLDKNVHLDGILFDKIIDHNEHFKSIYNDYGMIYTFIVGGFYTSDKLFVGTKKFNDISKNLWPDRWEFFDKCSWDLNNQYKLTPKNDQFWKYVDNMFPEGPYGIVYAAHGYLFSCSESNEMFSYMVFGHFNRKYPLGQ